MPTIIKCNPPTIASDHTVDTVEIISRPYKGACAEIGDAAYIWTSETAGGTGLAMRGIVREVIIGPGDGYQTICIRLDDVRPQRSLSIAQLRSLRDEENPSPLASLARKIYRHAHNKIASLDTDEALLLDGYFN